MNINIEGLDKLQYQLTQIQKSAMRELETTGKKVGLDLKGKSQELTPVLSGDLQGSAYVNVDVYGSAVDVEVGFEEIYAHYQHEGVHFAHPHGGQAKYLEVPYKANKEKYVGMIKSAVKRAISEVT